MRSFWNFITAVFGVLIVDIWSGFILMQAFNWIIVPKFAVEEMTLIMGCTIIVLFNFLKGIGGETSNPHRVEGEDDTDELKKIIKSVISSFFFGLINLVLFYFCSFFI